MKMLVKPFIALIRREISKEYKEPFKGFTISVVKEPKAMFVAEINGKTFERADPIITEKIFTVFDTEIKAKTNMDVDAIIAEVLDSKNNCKIWCLFKDENGNPIKELLS